MSMDEVGKRERGAPYPATLCGGACLATFISYPSSPKIHSTCSPLSTDSSFFPFSTVFGACLPVCSLAVVTFRNIGSSGYDTYGVVDYNGSSASVAAAADEEYRRIFKLKFAYISNTARKEEGSGECLWAGAVRSGRWRGVSCPHRLLRRILQSAAYLYQVGRFFLSAVILDETTGAGMYLEYLPIFVVNAPALVRFVIGSALVGIAFLLVSLP